MCLQWHLIRTKPIRILFWDVWNIPELQAPFGGEIVRWALPWECLIHIPAWLGESLCAYSLFSGIIQIIKWRRGWIPGLRAFAQASHSTIFSARLTSNTALLCHTQNHKPPWPWNISSKCLIKAVWQLIWFTVSYIWTNSQTSVFIVIVNWDNLPLKNHISPTFNYRGRMGDQIFVFGNVSWFEPGDSCMKNLVCNPSKHIFNLFKWRLVTQTWISVTTFHISLILKCCFSSTLTSLITECDWNWMGSYSWQHFSFLMIGSYNQWHFLFDKIWYLTGRVHFLCCSIFQKVTSFSPHKSSARQDHFGKVHIWA